jgi:hypothetical protein
MSAKTNTASVLIAVLMVVLLLAQFGLPRGETCLLESDGSVEQIVSETGDGDGDDENALDSAAVAGLTGRVHDTGTYVAWANTDGQTSIRSRYFRPDARGSPVS